MSRADLFDDVLAVLLLSLIVLAVWVVTDPPAFFAWLSLMRAS